MCSSNGFWGENSWWWIIILIWVCCGQGSGGSGQTSRIKKVPAGNLVQFHGLSPVF